MNKIKSFFSTPAKAAVSVLCILAALMVVGAGTVFAAGAIAKSSAIGLDSAQNFAFADAGVDPASVTALSTEFDFKNGQFVYEVEFTSGGLEYDYHIKASDGSVLKKQIEGSTAGGQGNTITAAITPEQAKEIALADAGLSASEVTFTKEKLDMDNGIAVYDIDFVTAGSKYEYEINAGTGAVFSRSIETAPVQSGGVQQQPGNQQPQGAEGQITLEAAKAAALADAGVAESEATFKKAELDYDNGLLVYDLEFYTSTDEYDYEVDAATGRIYSKNRENFSSNASSAGTGDGSYISVDSAKSIALSHAGVDASSAVFSKAKLERDDGRMVYEIEFYSGGMEYEYKLDASSGSILEYESDRD